MDFKQIVNERYATKKFNGEKIPEEKISELKELIRMSASSFGLQPYKIQIISDEETKKKLLEASMNQPQITTCSHLLVFMANTDVMGQIDKYEKMMLSAGADPEAIKGYLGMMRGFAAGMSDEAKIAWAQKQIYIALGNAINGAKALGFDSCPMEGFNPEEYAKILEVQEGLTPSVICPVGIAADEPRPKLRFSKEELFY